MDVQTTLRDREPRARKPFGSRNVHIPLLLLLSVSMQYCSTSKPTTSVEPVKTFENPVSYAEQIRPIMVQKCTPCHFPEKGRKKMLDTYEATQKNIDDILYRVQLPADHGKYMPYEGKKEALTAEEIKLLKDWLAQSMPQ